MKAILECKKLGKNYGQKKVLQGIDLSIEKGGPIGVVGPNGAGKTTFFSIICGFIKPTFGNIKVLGKTPNDPALSCQVSILPQDAVFPKNASIIYTITKFATLQGFKKVGAVAEAKKLLKQLGLEQSQDSYPDKLSHGMKKRVSIVQALLGNPQIILLDEPTAGLDPVTANNIRNIILERSDRATFLISSHNIEEIENLCSSVLVFKNGQLIKQDKIDNIVAKSRMLSVVLELKSPATLIEEIRQIKGIVKVTTAENDKRLLFIEFNESDSGNIQISLMQLLVNRGIAYKEFKTGRSLEQELVHISNV